MTSETWISIEHYERYAVSSEGRVRNSRTGRVLRPATDPDGYLRLALCSDGVCKTHKVHRLVARAFHGTIDDGMTVNHIDGVKTNNTQQNLEIVTRSANVAHAFRVIKTHSNAGMRNPRAILSAESVMAIRGRLQNGEGGSALAREYGVGKTAISRIKLGKAWV